MALSVPPKTDAPTVTCTIDGVEVTVPNGTTIYTAAKEAGIEIPVLCHDERYDPVGVCRMCAVDVGGRVLAAACVRPCEDGMEVTTAEREGREAARRPDRAADGRSARRGPQGDDHRRQPPARAGAPLRHRARRAAAAGARARRGLLEPGHQRQPRRVHPLRPLRPRLRRHPGQRRDRAHRQGLRDAHRVRPQRPDGRVDVRDLRRVRRRLPDRRARQQADPRRPDPPARGAQVGRHGLPVLRRRLRADLPRRRGARRDRVRRRPRAARQQEPPVREGPLRLGLRRLQAASDHAADPRHLPEGGALRRRQGRRPRPQATRRHRRLRRGHAALPRGDLGGGARPRGLASSRRSTTATGQARSPASARPSAPTRRPTSSRS